MNATKEKLKSVVAKALRLEGDAAVPDSGLIEALGIDSIKSLELLVWVENEFGIEIDDADLSAKLVDSLDTLSAYVERKVTVPPAAPEVRG